MLERYTILTPELLRHNEPEGLIPKRMKRVSDPNLLPINPIGCS